MMLALDPARIVDTIAHMPPGLPGGLVVGLIAWRLRPQPPSRLQGGNLDQPTDTGHTTAQDDQPARHQPALGGGAVEPVGAEFQKSRTPPSPKGTRGPIEHGIHHAPQRARKWVRRLPNRSGRDLAADLAMWCDAISSELRSGSSLATAVVTAERPTTVDATIGQRLADINRHDRLHLPLAERLGQIGEPPSAPPIRLIAAVLSTLARLGGSAAEPIDRTAAILRGQASVRAERAAHSAQARMSARVMTVLPVLMLALLSMTSGSVRQALQTPAGVFTITLGIVLNGCGWLWMRHIISASG